MTEKKLMSEIHDDDSEYTVFLSNADLPLHLKEVRRRLEERVVGQPIPIRRIMRGVIAYYAGFNDPKRPIGVFVFAGPSGSGKTYLAEELAYALIGEPEDGLSPLVKIDCGSLSLKHTVSSLTGSPPGYVGYGDKVSLEQVGEYDKKRKGLERVDKRVNQLYDHAQQKLEERGLLKYANIISGALLDKRDEIEERLTPFRSVVLFDEIEKADMNIQSQLLRILDEGELDLLNGKRVDFRGSIIILTTNVGTEQILSKHLTGKKIGFVPQQSKKDFQNLNEVVYREVLKEINNKRHFKPELLGRIGKPGIIVFNVLNQEDYQKILELRLKEYQNLLTSNRGPGAMLVSYTQDFKDFLIKEGISSEFGARALRAVIDKYVRVPVAEKALSGQLKIGDKILLDVKYTKGEGRTTIRRQKRPKSIILPDFEIKRVETEFSPDQTVKEIDQCWEDFRKKYLPNRPKQ